MGLSVNVVQSFVDGFFSVNKIKIICKFHRLSFYELKMMKMTHRLIFKTTYRSVIPSNDKHLLTLLRL